MTANHAGYDQVGDGLAANRLGPSLQALETHVPHLVQEVHGGTAQKGVRESTPSVADLAIQGHPFSTRIGWKIRGKPDRLP